MKIEGLDVEFTAVPAPVPVWHARVTASEWREAARLVRERGGRLLALWVGSATETIATSVDNTMAGEVFVAYVLLDGVFWLALPLDDSGGKPHYPDVSAEFPAAARMQRAAADLSGAWAQDFADQRPWLNHGAWAPEHYPLLQDAQAPLTHQPGELQDYAFVRVEGDGVHEIAVGPVHAGIIEPGHFRFSVVGEKILRLEQRLGYTHKGIEQRMTQLAPLDAYRLAGRVSGDSTVAYAWAYCMALESATQTLIPPRAAWLRALLLERERVANHLGDLGALGNDAAFAFALAQFSRLREDWLRNSRQAFAHRLMMDCIVPGGLAVDLHADQIEPMRQLCDTVESEVRRLAAVFEEHAGLQDRFLTTGRVSPALAARLCLTGLAGRASSQAADVRCDHPFAPYDDLPVTMALHPNGDVAARVAVRFEEVFESLRLIRRMLLDLPDGAVRCDVSLGLDASRGAGWVEGWRGEIFVALDLAGADRQHRILRCHLHDPSWQNWPVLEHAVMGNIVADFPLINKSFNLSYSGQDL